MASVLVVRSHKSEEKGFEEDGGEDEHEDHFDEESHKGEKGYHKKVFFLGICQPTNMNIYFRFGGNHFVQTFRRIFQDNNLIFFE